ncbi:Uncharacterised protein [Vibrio cholerae]|nr:Uncharacterised protein [Vibrio cholerae]CSB09581.1 Uncharacterised protein [Vibrio cholerae]CSC34314.1 Uncharacterised protein [Vibrio cholerae]
MIATSVPAAICAGNNKACPNQSAHNIKVPPTKAASRS